MAGKLTKEGYICPDCGHLGRGAVRLRGSAVIERLMWYILLIPGPIYSYWRRSDKKVECPDCKSENLVLLDSKSGALMLENQLRARKP